MSEPDELEVLRQRVAQLESGRRRGLPWGKVFIGCIALFLVLEVAGAILGPHTYGDIANGEAEKCIRSGNDGHWYPGQGDLKSICQIRGDAEALRRQGVDSAQRR